MNKTGFEYLDHDEWVSKYIPHMINENEIKRYDTHDAWETIRNTSPNLIWTWVTGDMSDLLVPGIGIVNRQEYYICEVPWTDLDEIVLLSTEEECKCYKPEGYPPVIGDINEDGDPNCLDCEGYGLITKYYEKEA